MDPPGRPSAEPRACTGFARIVRKFDANVLFPAPQLEKETGNHPLCWNRRRKSFSALGFKLQEFRYRRMPQHCSLCQIGK